MEDLGIILITGGDVPSTLTYGAYKLTDEMEVVKWDNRGIVLELKHYRYGNKVFKAIKNADSQEFVGYADYNVYLASRRNKVSTPSTALLPLSDTSIFIPALAGTDRILGTYKRISEDKICKRKITWPYQGATTPPFSVPLIADDQGNINLPPEAEEIVEADDCELFSATGTNFYQTYSEVVGIDEVVLSDISNLITQLDDEESDIKQAMIGLGSFPSLVYPQQQSTWSSETGPYDNWGNADFIKYRDFLKAYIENFKDNRAKIMAGATAEKMCQVARALDSEALKVLTVEEKLQMLEPLALQPIEEFWFGKTGFNEEFLVLKIVNAFDVTDTSPTNVDAITQFLDGLKKKFPTGQSPSDVTNLITSVRWQKSLFEMLYDRVGDSFFGVIGSNNREKLVFTLYALWLNSNYNPYRTGTYDENVILKWNLDIASGGFDRPYTRTERPALLNYQSTKSGGIYKDSFVFSFGPDGDGIYWVEEGDIAAGYDFTASAIYDFYQPISLVSTKQDTFYKLPEDNNFIPPFFLKYIDDKGDENDFNTKIGYVLDVVSVASGIGAIVGLRHLRTLSQLGQLALGILELSSGAISFYLTYTDNNCSGNTAFCDKLKKVLFWVEVASLSGDFLATQMARRSARDIVSQPSGKPADFDDDPWDELVNLADLDSDLADFLNDILQSHPNVHSKVNAFANQEDKFAFYFGAQRIDGQKRIDFLDRLDSNPDLIDEWENIQYLKSARNNIDFLESYRLINNNNDLLKHVHDGDTKLITRTDQSGAFVGNTGADVTGYHNPNKLVDPPPNVGQISWKNPPPKNSNPNSPDDGYTMGKIERNMFDFIDPKTNKEWVNGNVAYPDPPDAFDVVHRKTKKQKNVFWPKNYDTQRINEEMAYVYSQIDSNVFEITDPDKFGKVSFIYQAKATDGKTIEVMFYDGNLDSGTLVSIYPTYF